MSTALETRQFIQKLLHVAEDGVFGPRTLAAIALLGDTRVDAEWPAVAPLPTGEGHSVKATSFADPADIRAFRQCKERGNSDQFCFKSGDNGVGKWGDDCSAGSGPRCALPPEDWAQFGVEARGKKVLVTHGDKQVVCELRDTMPHKANVTNGAGIDLNPDACALLGIPIPAEARVTWQWA